MSEFSGSTTTEQEKPLQAFAIYSPKERAFLRNYRHVKYHWDSLPTLFDTVEDARKCLSGLKGYRTYRDDLNPRYLIDISDAKIVELQYVMGTKDLK